MARTWYSPLDALDAGFTSKRTVRDSSARSNLIASDSGVAVQPFGRSSRTVVSAGPVVSFTTVTRISRSARGGPEVDLDAAPAGRRLAAGADRIDAAGMIAT